MAESLAHVTGIDATLPLSSASSGVIGETPLARSAGYVSARLAGAVDHEVHRVLTGHVLLAKEPYGGAFCLGEPRSLRRRARVVTIYLKHLPVQRALTRLAPLTL
jgi:hypothetical protein